MNFVGYFMTLLVSVAIGYIVYPLFFTTQEELVPEYMQEVTVLGQQGRMTIAIDVREIKENEVPDEVRLTKSALLSNPEGTELKMESGAKVKVLQYENENLTIAANSEAFQATVPYEATDFLKGVARKRLDNMLGIDSRPQSKPKAPIAAAQPKPKPTATAKIKKAPKPKEPKKDLGPLTLTLEEQDLLALLKTSIEKKAVSEFTVDQVKKWEDGGKETIGPKDYQIGYATYGKETIFGFQPVVAKALVRNGKVEKWVYAKSGIAIP